MKTGILLSGGMDSIALAHWRRPDLALTIDYGQLPASGEIQAAAAACAALELTHEILRIDCRAVGSGDLAGTPALSTAPVSEWWPYRNQLLITLGAAFLLSRGISKLLLGCVKTDQIHADGRAEFIATMSELLRIQEGNMTVEAPAIGLTSIELIVQSNVSREILSWAHSCHVSDFACGYCRGCLKHFETTKALGYGPY